MAPSKYVYVTQLTSWIYVCLLHDLMAAKLEDYCLAIESLHSVSDHLSYRV